MKELAPQLDISATVDFLSDRRVVIAHVQGLMDSDTYANVRWLALAKVQTGTAGLVMDYSACIWGMPRGGVAFGTQREYQDVKRVLGVRPLAIVGSEIVAASVETSMRQAAALGIMSRVFASRADAAAWCSAHHRVLAVVRPAARSGRALL
jgi:hypothetical protein